MKRTLTALLVLVGFIALVSAQEPARFERGLEILRGNLTIHTGNLVMGTSATFQATQQGTGYSFNLIDVTSTTDSGNTRGWRVNTTTSDSITHGDLQSIHAYETLGSGVTLGSGAAIYPLSGWLDLPADLTTGTGNVIAVVRGIFDANGVDWTSLGGGGESALAYFQTWAAASSQIDEGVAIVAGAGTTIDSAIRVGGTGTYTQVFDMTDWDADTTLLFLVGGPKDANEDSQFIIAIGDANSAGAIATAVGAASDGSIFISTAGTLWQVVSGTWTQNTV